MAIGLSGTSKLKKNRFNILVLCRGVGVIDRGAERATKDLATSLSPHHDVKILAYGQTHSVLTVHQGSNFGFINRLPNFFLQILEILRLSPINLEAIGFAVRASKIVRRLNPDIIISTGGPWEILILRLSRRRLPFKIISIGHGGYEIEKQQVRAKPDCHVTLSRFSESKLCDLGRNVPIQRIQNMVDSTLFNVAGRGSTVSSERKSPVVLIVAAAVEYKNIDITMKAVAKAGYHLIWCGDGALKNQLVALANSLFEEGAFRWMTVPLKDMPSVYQEADIFTLASKKNIEAYGLVYLEAMLSGLRCVVTDDDIRREICGDDGLFIDPSDIANYEQGLKLAWKRTQEFGPLKWAPGPHSVNAVTESFLDLFESMVRN